MVLNEDQALYLQENNEMFLAEDMNYSLAEDQNDYDYGVGYYPEFGGM